MHSHRMKKKITKKKIQKQKASTNSRNLTYLYTVSGFILSYPTQTFSEKPPKAEITALDWIQLLPSLSVAI